MTKERAELIDWCVSAQKDARDQLELFGPKGVKATLQMPDGTTPDITEAVIRHQTKNLAAFERLQKYLQEEA